MVLSLIRTIYGRGFRFVAPVSTSPRAPVVAIQNAIEVNDPIGDGSAVFKDTGATDNSKPSIVVLPFQLRGAGPWPTADR